MKNPGWKKIQLKEQWQISYRCFVPWNSLKRILSFNKSTKAKIIKAFTFCVVANNNDPTIQLIFWYILPILRI